MLRECDSVRGDPAVGLACFLEKLSLRICATGATEIGLVAVGLTGNSSLEVSVGEIGEVTGVEEAMVPPTPVRDVTGLILSGAFLVIAHDVGGMLTTGVTRAGL